MVVNKIGVQHADELFVVIMFRFRRIHDSIGDEIINKVTTHCRRVEVADLDRRRSLGDNLRTAVRAVTHQVDEYIDSVVVYPLSALCVRQFGDIDKMVAVSRDAFAIFASVIRPHGIGKNLEFGSVMQFEESLYEVACSMIPEVIGEITDAEPALALFGSSSGECLPMSFCFFADLR